MTSSKMLTALAVAIGLAPSAQAAKYEIRWVLAHEPAGVFEQAAKEFAALVSEGTKGEVSVRVISAKEFGGGRYVSPDEVARKVASGDIEMTQTYTTSLGKYSKKLLVLDMPYLFRDHEHATKVLDGAIGRDLLASLEPRHMKGLAFTYSGGYRILPSTSKEIHTPSDMKGLRVRTSGSPVAIATIRALGGVPVPTKIEDTVPLAKAGKIDAGESTLPRFEDGHQEAGVPVINDTEHSLFVTAVIVNDKYFASLPKADQDAISAAALKMAGIERKRSVDDAVRVKAEAIQKGEKVISLTEAEHAQFVAAVKPVYDRFQPRLHGLVERIQNEK